MEGDIGNMGGLINPRSGCGQYRAGFSNTPSLERGRRVKKGIVHCLTLVAQGVSVRLTRHILKALLPQGELKEWGKY